MAAKVRGSFKTFSGAIRQGEDAESTSVGVTIEAASIDTGAEDRDNHLLSGDFLDTEAYPEITFESTSITRQGGRFDVVGDLTIKDVTKPVTLAMTYGGIMSDPWGNEKAIFSGETNINREDFGLTWNQALEAGGWLVGKDVSIAIEVQAAKA
jgi:polyisoprenoid-binding protein YceI